MIINHSDIIPLADIIEQLIAILY